MAKASAIHGELTHGLFAYDTTLRVPLIIAGPGIPPAVREAPVSHVDLMPTVLELLGLDIPDGLQGRTLRSELSGPGEPVPPIYFEALNANLTRGWAPLTGIVADRWKLIDLPIPELYDLEADPGETTNLFERETARARRLQPDLMRMKTRGATESTSVPVEADARARLRALGYTSGPGRRTDPDRVFTADDDPKMKLDVHLAWRDVLQELATVLESPDGREAALDILEVHIERYPQFAPAYTSAATLLIDLLRPDDAVELLDRALAQGLPTDAMLERLSLALLHAGEPERAAEVLEPFVSIDDPWADDVNRLGVAYAAIGRIDDARRQFRRALDFGPTAEIWKNLGVLDTQSGNLEDAERAFREATRADPQYAPGWRLLGTTLQETDPAGAIDAWRRTIELRPDDAEALFDLARLLTDVGSPQDARPYLERYVADAPPGTNSASLERAEQILAALDGR